MSTSTPKSFITSTTVLPPVNSRLSAENQKLIQYLLKAQAQGHAYVPSSALLMLFCPSPSCAKASERFKARLSRMQAYRVLENLALNGQEGRWVVGPSALKAEPKESPAQKAADELKRTTPKWVGPIVPPRRVDVMNGPPYVPMHTASTRAGADDFRACRSVGVRC